MTGLHDRPLPHQIHPAFYGCYDWHSRALRRGRRYAVASLPVVCGGDYMVEHWLACYAVLMLT